MKELKTALYRGYVNNKLWNINLAKNWGYVPVSRKLIRDAKDIVYEKGVRVAIIDPKNRGIRLPDDYLFQGNLVRINPLLTARPVPMWGPDIELHSETEEGLTKLIKDLGFSFSGKK